MTSFFDLIGEKIPLIRSVMEIAFIFINHKFHERSYYCNIFPQYRHAR
jgi:hypothetical protein